MTWAMRRILVTVKAAPITTKNHGECICTAGITDEGEFIRVYPVPLQLWKEGKGFKKFDWIEVECEESTDEILERKESHHLKSNSPIKIIDRSLSTEREGGDWSGRNDVVLRLRAKSIETLKEDALNDRTSLGLIRVGQVFDFYKGGEMSDEEKGMKRLYQAILDLEEGERPMVGKTWVLQQMPHIFKYRFQCDDLGCPTHDMTCEDWEAFESYRRWRSNYPDEDVLWQKMKQRYLNWMAGRDLHFFMGTHNRYGNWLIIGLYYPPKEVNEHAEEISTLDNYA